MLFSSTVASGTLYQATQQQRYSILRDENGGVAGVCQTVTDTKGVQTRYIMDGLDRVHRVERQDDDGQWNTSGNIKIYSGIFRPVEERSYNALNQCISVVNIDWLRGKNAKDAPTQERTIQTFKYDDWGQVCKSIHSDGVVTSSVTDPITLTHTEGIEGEGKTKNQLNLFGDPAQRILLKKDGSVYSEERYDYDGLGRPVKSQDALNHIKQFHYDCFDRVLQIIWPDNHVTSTEYPAYSAAALPTSIKIKDDSPFAQQSFDGLDRLVSRTVGRRTTIRSYHESEPEPKEITISNEEKYSLAYEPALSYALKSITSNDQADSYESDHQTAALSKLENSYSTQKLHYLPSGLLAQEDIQIKGETKTNSSQSNYSMSGKLNITRTSTDKSTRSNTTVWVGLDE